MNLSARLTHQRPRALAAAATALLASALTPAAANANIIINPGFETGDLTGWTVLSGSAAVGVVGVRSGVYAMGTSTLGPGQVTVRQSFDPVPVEDIIELSVWARVLAFDAGGASITLGYDDGTFESIGVAVADGVWTLRTLTANLDAGRSLEFIQVGVSADWALPPGMPGGPLPGFASALWDDFTLNLVPSPGAASLLVLGLAAIARSRRTSRPDEKAAPLHRRARPLALGTAALLASTLAPAAASADNILLNPGFETGDLTGWSIMQEQFHPLVWSTEVHSGDHALLTGGLGFLWILRIRQTFEPVPVTDIAELSFWASAMALSGPPFIGNARLIFGYDDGTTGLAPLDMSAHAWTPYNVTHLLDPARSLEFIEIFAQTGLGLAPFEPGGPLPGEVSVAWDDFTLNVPTPAAASLLLLGLATIAPRRRR